MRECPGGPRYRPVSTPECTPATPSGGLVRVGCFTPGFRRPSPRLPVFLPDHPGHPRVYPGLPGLHLGPPLVYPRFPLPPPYLACYFPVLSPIYLLTAFPDWIFCSRALVARLYGLLTCASALADANSHAGVPMRSVPWGEAALLQFFRCWTGCTNLGLLLMILLDNVLGESPPHIHLGAAPRGYNLYHPYPLPDPG